MFVFPSSSEMKARGFLREADKKEAEAEVFSGPSSLAGETYQSLFDQVGGWVGGC